MRKGLRENYRIVYKNIKTKETSLFEWNDTKDVVSNFIKVEAIYNNPLFIVRSEFKPFAGSKRNWSIVIAGIEGKCYLTYNGMVVYKELGKVVRVKFEDLFGVGSFERWVRVKEAIALL